MEFIILIAVFGLMMWMMSRGAKRQRQAAEELRNSLEVGNQVMTASGFYGTIVDIDGDVVTLESTPGVETMWKREAIASVTEPPFAIDEDEETTDEVAGLSVPDDASALTGSAGTTDAERDQAEPQSADRPTDENDDRRA